VDIEMLSRQLKQATHVHSKLAFVPPETSGLLFCWVQQPDEIPITKYYRVGKQGNTLFLVVKGKPINVNNFLVKKQTDPQ